MAGSGQIWIGTSGWHYAHWVGRLYPEGMLPEDYLAFYAGRFDTVEINNTFYQLPSQAAVLQWRRSVPPGFIFAVKASRYITHFKKLKDPEEPLANVIGRVGLLGDRLGPILFQLPPRWRLDLERLRRFLAVLPPGQRYAFEFRDPSWLDERVYRELSNHGAALCVYDLGGHWSPEVVTADFVYVRFHGPDGRYQGHYRTEELAERAATFRGWAKQGRDVYAYFNNDWQGHAVRDATELLELLGS
ncbi:MAG: DUF72 domain-containing protein [Anaerolineae bacterium]|nr:DUF72 domain-containing protein [Anaerolineae bacterium]